MNALVGHRFRLFAALSLSAFCYTYIDSALKTFLTICVSRKTTTLTHCASATNSTWFSGETTLISLFIFQDIRPMRDQIVRVKRFEKVPLILVGNKVDLESEREVAGSDGRALAQEWGCPFIETSAKSKTMVDELFAEIVRQMNYSTLPEKQEQCCTACVVQWGRGTSTAITIFLCMAAFILGLCQRAHKHSTVGRSLILQNVIKCPCSASVKMVHKPRRNVAHGWLCGIFSAV